MIKFLDIQKVTAKYADEIHDAMLRVVDGGWYLLGEENKRFENDYAEFIGTNYCVGCANGLDALTLMLRGCMELGLLQKGDEIIVPANTYIATILSISENGLTPVLVEPRLDTLQIDDSLISTAITPKTKGIMIVHLYGQCAMTDRIAEICNENGLLLFEDNAQAHGCKYHGKRTGSIGFAAAHSFYPGKNLGALGDGGAITTDNKELADTVRALANYGSNEKYVFKYQGRNSRLDEVQAAILDIKLKHLDDDTEIRRSIARYYIANISNPLIKTPTVNDWGSHVFHLFTIFCEQRDNLKKHLADNGIQTVIHYPIPPHRQECYKEWNNLSFPITERIHAQELSLPISPVMTQQEVEEVVRVVNSFKAN